ncbi:uncharacterized protein [Cicer arietinum]|uniref:GATA zinc finger domain-containing protein 10 n=1 Tax=Cicer arietinum TaxID=3827 RepID=A0A1S2Y2S7_CICAR|nr:GATA zinc finger domain-containing protein 10 [Cicer arietinum]
MEANGIFSNITTSALLGVVDIPLQQQQQQQQNLQIQQNPHHLHHSQVVSYVSHHHDTDNNTHQQQQLQQPIKHGYPPFSSSNSKIKQQQQQQSSHSQLSDEDEPNFPAEESSGGDPKRKISPWQRMKWTDTMVRLLIMAVYYIGDEAGSEGNNNDPMSKKKPSGLLQKKGKWKSVSRAMMEKGFYVSPQQCEDKFNDLNKRYKRVNDILGKGTACRVVENQNLLDSMDLTTKMKEEVRKLLNSKHLFFREMCAYHNSCGHGSVVASSNVQQQQVEGGTTTPPPQAQPQQHQQQQLQQQQQQCFHSSENGLKMLKIGNGEGEEEDDESEDDDSEDDSDEEDDESREGGSKNQIGHFNDQDEDENDGKLLTSSRKRARKEGGFAFSMSSLSSSTALTSTLMHQMKSEISGVFQDGGKSPWEKKQWIRSKIMMLEEEKVRYLSQEFELEKQRLKWARFSSKKEREMERAKVENERRRLENERMVLIIRQKEIELMSLQQQQQHQQQHSST